MTEDFQNLINFLNSRDEEFQDLPKAFSGIIECIFSFYGFEANNGTALTPDNVKITYKSIKMGKNVIIIVQIGSRCLRCTLTYSDYVPPNVALSLVNFNNIGILCSHIHTDIMGPLLEEHGLHLTQRILFTEIKRCIDKVVPNDNRSKRNVFAAFLHCLVTAEITENFQLSLLSPNHNQDDTLIQNFPDDWLEHSNRKYLFQYEFRGNGAELHVIPMGNLMQVMVRMVSNGKSEIIVRRSYSFDRFYVADAKPPAFRNVLGTSGLISSTKNSIIKRGFYPLLGKSHYTSRILQIPDQVLFNLFEMLGWKDLVSIAKVCSKTKKMSGSVYLWKRHVRNVFKVNETETNWKYEFMSRWMKKKASRRRIQGLLLPPPPVINWFPNLWRFGEQMI